METGIVIKQSYLEEKREDLVQRQKCLLKAFQKAVQADRGGKSLSRLYERICRTREFLEALSNIEREAAASALSQGQSRYVISSLFLHECFKALTLDASEEFFFVTGSLINGVYVLDQKAEFQHQKRTVVSVVGQIASTHKLLIKLEQFGHRLLGCFHSHPGKGPDATHSSGIDEKFQKRLEDGGHIAVAAIFSRDGYVRFFRMDKEPEIEIYGEGVERYGKNIFYLTNIDQN
jgi:hypothetical protein